MPDHTSQPWWPGTTDHVLTLLQLLPGQAMSTFHLIAELPDATRTQIMQQQQTNRLLHRMINVLQEVSRKSVLAAANGSVSKSGDGGNLTRDQTVSCSCLAAHSVLVHTSSMTMSCFKVVVVTRL